MFRGWVVAILGLLTLFGGVLAYILSDVEEEDLGTYQRLLERSQKGPVEAAPSAAQDRIHVVKDLWLAEGADRLHTRLTSERSQLAITYDGGVPEAVELMEDVTAFMQEGLYYLLPDGRRAKQTEPGLYRIEGERGGALMAPQEGWTAMQEIRYLRAKQATYDYRTCQFAAEEVSIVRFECAGHLLVESLEGIVPAITGTARAVEFTLGGKELDFRAHHVKAKIFAEEHLL